MSDAQLFTYLRAVQVVKVGRTLGAGLGSCQAVQEKKVLFMMMSTKQAMAALGLFLSCSATQAEVIGGQVKLSRSGFTDDMSIAKTNLSGNIELGFGPQFGMQLDFGLNRLNTAGKTATNVAAHAVYKLSDSTAFGAFYGLDSLSGGRQNFYGIEAAQNFGTGGLQGYLARGKASGASGTVVGLSGSTMIGSGFGIGASLDSASLDGGVSLTRFGVRGSYGVGERSKMFAEIGSLNGDISGVGSDSETYAKIGATYNFGANSGLTFGDRSLFNLLPGL